MPDYNLFGLSTRSFEQLVQALAAQIIGPDILIFGDGPDGAREATFSGKIPYPSKQSPWKGDGIVQAKFLQRPHAKPKQDADWLLGQLSEEMKKFAKPGTSAKKKRPAPDYYVLATNVFLSAKAKSGGKDRVEAAMKDYQRTFGWKAHEIWDGDKISRFLDKHRNIATTYAGWITSGDVMAAVIANLKLQRTDFHEVISAFLQKELMAAQFANLRQAGHSDQERVPLSRVFVDLPVTQQQTLEPPELSDRVNDAKSATQVSTFMETLIGAGSVRLAQSEATRFVFGSAQGRGLTDLVVSLPSMEVQASYTKFHGDKITIDPSKPVRTDVLRSIKALAGSGKTSGSTLRFLTAHEFSAGQLSSIFLRKGRIVLLGGPGQGKTTVGQFACQLYRVALLQHSRRLIAREVRDALELIRAQCKTNVPTPTGRRYPIHIDLKVLASFLGNHDKHSPPSLLEFLRERISQRAAAEVSLRDIRLWLQHYPWFVVFDGLDEVPASANRAEVVQCINDFMVDADSLDADLLVLATCRPQSYAKEFDDRYYRHLWLAPLSENRALDYGKRLLGVRHAPGQDREIYEARLTAAAKTPTTARLMRSPLQVTIMTALVERVGRPPEQRWSLFSEYYRVIYDRETERGTKWSDALRDHKSDVDLLHRQIAHLLQRRSESAGETEAKLTTAEYKELITQRLSREGHTGDKLVNLVSQLCEAVRDRLVFLAGITDKHVGFEIRSLQEFMAADFLIDAADAAGEHEKTVKDNLRSISTSIYWRNVFLFAAGRVLAKERHLREFITGLCQEANELTEDSAAAAVLAGSQLALDLLEDGSARTQPNTIKALMRVATRLLDLPIASFHDRLGAQCSAELEVVLCEELERRLASGSELSRLASWRCLLQLCNAPRGWDLRLVERHWPVDQMPPISINDFAESVSRESPLVQRFARVSTKMSPVSLVQSSVLYSGRPRTELLGETLPLALRCIDMPSILKCRLVGCPAETGLTFWVSACSSAESDVALPNPEFVATWHRGWSILLAASRFGLEPTSKKLAESLRCVAEHWDQETVAAFNRGFPWQFGACIATCRSSSDATRLSKLAAAGRLGDTLLWRAAEQRWSKRGITPDDILATPPELCPFDEGIADAGFPPTFQSFEVNVPEENTEVLCSFLVQLAAKTTTSVQKEIVCFLIDAYLDRRDFRKDPAKVRRIIEQCVESDIWLGCDRIATAYSKSDDPESQALVFDTFGRGQVYLDGHWVWDNDDYLSGFSRFLSEQYLRDSSRVGLMRLLSAVAPLEREHSIPRQLLEPARWQEAENKAAALAIRLGQLDWKIDEATELAGNVTLALSTRPRLLARLCAVLDRTKTTNLDLEALPVALLKSLPTSAIVERSKLVATLIQLISRRRIATRHEFLACCPFAV